MKNEKSKPTRIMREPELVMTKAGRSYEIQCDNGKIYDLATLAATIPIAQSSLSARLKKLGWQNKNILKRIVPVPEVKMQESPYKVWQPGDLAHLSDRPRR